jgi:hypothetical protein
MLWYVERNEIMGVTGVCCDEHTFIDITFCFFVTMYIRNVMFIFFLYVTMLCSPNKFFFCNVVFFVLHYVSYLKLKQSKVGNPTYPAYIYSVNLVNN